MDYFIILILCFSVAVFSQSRETLKEIWRDIEEYEKMKKYGYKPFSPQEPCGLFYFDLFYFAFLIVLFGCLGYLLALIS
jgi:hypothetical protein